MQGPLSHLCHGGAPVRVEGAGVGLVAVWCICGGGYVVVGCSVCVYVCGCGLVVCILCIW